jgi:retron-type reverse transcriptase
MNTDNLMKRLKSLCYSKKESKVKDLYKILYKEDIYFIAYQNIYSKKCVIDNDIIKKLINEMRTNTFVPTPYHRIYISNRQISKTTQLKDKLVQEACKIILEHVYDNKFSELSFGYRKGRSCISVFNEISKWPGTTWFIKFDISDCFEKFSHKILLNILREKIKDDRFIKLIKHFLKAGYIDGWKLHDTFSGIPQGNILSPILSNIYLDKLDKYVEEIIIPKYTSGTKRTVNKQYKKIQDRTYNLRKQKLKYDDEIFPKYQAVLKTYESIKTEYVDELMTVCYMLHLKDIENQTGKLYKQNKYGAKRNYYLRKVKDITNIQTSDLKLLIDIEQLFNKYETICNELEIKTNEQLNTTYSSDDQSYSRIKYCRYADDFLIGYIGSLTDAYKIKQDISTFLENELKLTLSNEKTSITNARKGILFLGYEISKWNNNGQLINVTDKNGIKFKKNRNKIAIRFTVPESKMISFVKLKKYGSYAENRSDRKPGLVNFDDAEIIKQYNSELRGLAYFYRYAYDWKKKVGKVQWLCHYSLLKTLACKYKCSVAQIFKKKIIKVDHEKNWYIDVGDEKIKVFKIKNVETKHPKNYSFESQNIDQIPKFQINIRNSYITKKLSQTCSVCNNSEVKIQLHHKRKIGNINGVDWLDKVHIMRNRKVIPLCEQCHKKIT